MKIHSSLLFLLLIVLYGCQPKAAFDFNQKLVEIENSLLPDMERTEEKVSSYVLTGNYDSIALVSGAMARIVESKLEEVKKIDAPKVSEGETFKKAYIRYFEYLGSIYTGYHHFGKEATETGREQQSERLMKLLDKKDQVIAELQGIQRQYAKANGFKMEE